MVATYKSETRINVIEMPLPISNSEYIHCTFADLVLRPLPLSGIKFALLARDVDRLFYAQ